MSSGGDSWKDYLIGILAALFAIVGILIVALAIRKCVLHPGPKGIPKPAKDNSGTPAFTNAMYGVIGNFARPSLSGQDTMSPIDPKYMSEKINPAFDDTLEGATGYSPRLMHKIIIPPSPEGSPLLSKKMLPQIAEISSGCFSLPGKGSRAGSPSLLQQTLVNQTIGIATSIPTPQLQNTGSQPGNYVFPIAHIHPPPYTEKPGVTETSVATPDSQVCNSDKEPLVDESTEYDTIRGLNTALLYTIHVTPDTGDIEEPANNQEENVYCSLADIDTRSITK